MNKGLVEFTPTAADMEGQYYGLLVASLDDSGDLIAVGPNVTVRRALAAWSAYARTALDADGSSHRLLREDLADGVLAITVTPTSFTRAGDEWEAWPDSIGAEPAAWLAS